MDYYEKNKIKYKKEIEDVQDAYIRYKIFLYEYISGTF